MRVQKHLIKPISEFKGKENKVFSELKDFKEIKYENIGYSYAFLLLIYRYQQAKNYFLMKLNEHNWNQGVNFRQDKSYRQIRDTFKKSLKENESEYIHQLGLRSHHIDMALKEAYDTQFRTWSAGISFVQNKLIRKYNTYLQKGQISQSEFDFLFHIINHVFYNYHTYKKFESVLFKTKFISNCQDYINKIKGLTFPKEVLKSNLFPSFLRAVQKLIKKHIYNTDITDIVGKINPTISLDSTLYDFKFDGTTQKYQLHISGLQDQDRLFFELSGFKGGLSLKKNHFGNLVISYEPTTNQFFVHLCFTKNRNTRKIKAFSVKDIKETLPSNLELRDYLKLLKIVPLIYHKTPIQLRKNIQISPFYCHLFNQFDKNKLIKLENQAIGVDYGYHETGTSSHDIVFGQKQHEILKKEGQKQEEFLRKVQLSNKINFGVEKKNSGKRNTQNNFFNCNQLLKNININYHKQVKKSSCRLDEFIQQTVNDLLKYCLRNNIHYICLEELNFKQGKSKKRTKCFNRQINIMKTGNFYELLQRKIDINQLDIQIIFIDPAYTSQMCSQCGCIHQENRQSNMFCCQACGFSGFQDLGVELYTQIDDFNASLNIKNLALLKAFSEEFSKLLKVQSRKDILVSYLQFANEFHSSC